MSQKETFEPVGLTKLDLTKLDYNQKTAVRRISVYPKYDKDFKDLKVVKAFSIVCTMEITQVLGDFLLQKSEYTFKREISGEEYHQLVKHLMNPNHAHSTLYKL